MGNILETTSILPQEPRTMLLDGIGLVATPFCTVCISLASYSAPWILWPFASWVLALSVQ
ncbi:hypothetical protein BDW71DRAFT_177256 [Aspergillus fruticulosus]